MDGWIREQVHGLNHFMNVYVWLRKDICIYGVVRRVCICMCGVKMFDMCVVYCV